MQNPVYSRLFDSSCGLIWSSQNGRQHIFFAYIYVDEKEEDPWHFATTAHKVIFKRSKYKLMYLTLITKTPFYLVSKVHKKPLSSIRNHESELPGHYLCMMQMFLFIRGGALITTQIQTL